MIEDKIIFKLEENLKREFKNRTETSTRATMSDVLRGCIFYLLSLGRQEFRNFVHKCEDLEFEYYANVQAQGDFKFKIMEERLKIKDALGAAYDEKLINFDFRKEGSKPGALVGIKEAYELLQKYKSGEIPKEQLKKDFEDLNIPAKQTSWKQEHKI